MSRRLSPSFAPPRALAAAVLAVFALGLLAGPPPAGASAKFQRGGLPSIGAIALEKTEGGRAEISVPVTYRKALAGPPRGLESTLVTLSVAARLRHGAPVGTLAESTRSHRLSGSDTFEYRFFLSPRESGQLFGKSRKLRGKLVRVEVSQRATDRRGARPLHEKSASSTMASSHRAQPQGASGELMLVNDTPEPVNTLAYPIMCMYAYGEEGSNPQAFTATGLRPGGTIEAEIEASASILDDAEYEGPRGASAGIGFDALGIAADVIGDAFELELGPFIAAIDLTSHCEAMASIFSIAAANQQGNAASSQAWVLTDETCRIGCPRNHLISTYEALGFQSPGQLNGNTIWASDSTEVLEGFDGYYYPAAPNKGRAVQDNGLHFEWEELSKSEWNVKVGEGSKPGGFSG